MDEYSSACCILISFTSPPRPEPRMIPTSGVKPVFSLMNEEVSLIFSNIFQNNIIKRFFVAMMKPDFNGKIEERQRLNFIYKLGIAKAHGVFFSRDDYLVCIGDVIKCLHNAGNICLGEFMMIS